VAFSPVSDLTFDVSSRFGGVALSGFRIAGNGQVSGVAIRTVSCTTAAAVPEASTLAMAGLVALAGLGVARRRRRAA
jgi:MYXO-CTERM domain-containing protein